jgi:hypothetical protein
MLPSISTFEPGQHDWFKEQSTLAIKRVDGCSFHPTAYVVHNDGWRCLYNEILLIKSTWMSFRSEMAGETTTNSDWQGESFETRTPSQKSVHTMMLKLTRNLQAYIYLIQYIKI